MTIIIVRRKVQLQRLWISSLVILCVFNLAGCNSTSKKLKLDSGDMTMTQIYEQTSGLELGSASGIPAQKLNVTANNTSDAILPKPTFDTSITMDDARAQVQSTTAARVYYAGYTRTAENETNNLFKPLANPSVPVYLYPHLSQVGEDIVPVPGYTTSFFLYQQPYFALPSERY